MNTSPWLGQAAVPPPEYVAQRRTTLLEKNSSRTFRGCWLTVGALVMTALAYWLVVAYQKGWRYSPIICFPMLFFCSVIVIPTRFYWLILLVLAGVPVLSGTPYIFSADENGEPLCCTMEIVIEPKYHTIAAVAASQIFFLLLLWPSADLIKEAVVTEAVRIYAAIWRYVSTLTDDLASVTSKAYHKALERSAPSDVAAGVTIRRLTSTVKDAEQERLSSIQEGIDGESVRRAFRKENGKQRANSVAAKADIQTITGSLSS